MTSDSYAGSYITLDKGYWLINIGVLLKTGTVSTASNNKWIRFTLGSNSSSGTAETVGFSFVGASLVSGYSPFIQSSGNYNFVNGVIPIYVTADNTTIYLRVGTIDTIGTYTADVTIGNSDENYFCAIPTTQSE